MLFNFILFYFINRSAFRASPAPLEHSGLMQYDDRVYTQHKKTKMSLNWMQAVDLLKAVTLINSFEI